MVLHFHILYYDRYGKIRQLLFHLIVRDDPDFANIFEEIHRLRKELFKLQNRNLNFIERVLCCLEICVRFEDTIL